MSPDNTQTVKIKNQVLLLEQKLRSTPSDSPIQNPNHYSTHSPVESKISGDNQQEESIENTKKFH